MPRNYVDNAYNRSAGRVGMPVGSAVISRSSGGGGGSYGYSSGGGGSYGHSSGGSTRSYVDNAYNRNVGRVGLPVGSAVISTSSGGGGGSSCSSGSSNRSYVDNAYNRSAGRVGLPVGSAVISTSSGGGGGSSYSSNRSYVDNAYNRSAGRVGLPVGSAAISKSSSATSTGIKSGTCYVDNAYNRNLGRVGLPRGSALMSNFSVANAGSRGTSTGQRRCYVDNDFNRRLGRVGKEVGTAVYSANRSSSVRRLEACPTVFQPLFDFDPEDPGLPEIYRELEVQKQACQDNPKMYHDCEVAQGIINRHDAAIAEHSSSQKFQKPEWLRGGEVIEWADIEIGDKLGGEGFGDVHVAIWKGRHQVAVKKLRVQRVHERKRLQFEEEVKVLSALEHPAIVKFFGACVKSPNLAILMEFMAGGSLYDVLHVECRKLSAEQKLDMTDDILSALDYIHERKVVHRDIKSQNVLLTEDLKHCKLSDFGLALKQESESSSSIADFSVVGTIRYSSPEMLEGNRLALSGLKAACGLCDYPRVVCGGATIRWNESASGEESGSRWGKAGHLWECNWVAIRVTI